ncbi:luciferin 4-monooxygenase-like [Anticarsia gemmatalis]|uniref:luciferin 4-monooxygenase-like n=1 Tax=Anticarsia gemmatalis TaxID=129554 RepID=UPI003F7586E8
MQLIDINNDKCHMGHLFFHALKSRPNEICQVDAATGESETNASVLRRSIQLARCLRRLGVQPGDVLALGGRNHLDLHIPYYAALLNGMPIAGVDPLFKYTEIKAHFKVSSPRVAFCQKEYLDDHLRVIKELGLDTKLICFDDGEYSLKRFLEEYDDNNNDLADFAPLTFDLDKVYAWLISTGGTTGVLKLAAFKHKTFLMKMMELQKLFKKDKEEKLTGENRPALHLSPVQWISGFFNALCFPLMQLTKISTSAPVTTEHVIDIINKYKPITAMFGPSLASAIVKSDKECDLTCFDSIMVAGAKVHRDTFLELQKRVRPGIYVQEAYGQTENLGPILIPNPKGPIGNCGKSPYDWQTIKLVDPETGKRITEPNTPGEMWTKGACFSEYYNNPEETAKAFTEDGWYRTGDILYKDEEGNYFFVERVKMLIKYRSYHIVPYELEAVIREHPGVLDVSVTSIPHEEDGDHAVACVVRTPGSDVTAQEIKDLVASKLSDSQKLRGGVMFMREIPLTSSGKVARAKLRQMALTAHRE